jgi:iron complex transport system ATP-binding protein
MAQLQDLPADRIEGEARDVLEEVEGKDWWNLRCSALSHGMAKRVQLAQALIGDPEIVLLDEPTAGLDPAHARSVFAMLRTQCDAGAAAVVVTHDLDLALRYGGTMWLIANGQLAAQGTPAEVLASPATREAFALDIHVGTLPSGARFAVPV